MAQLEAWEKLANKELSRLGKKVEDLHTLTAEEINIKPLYTEADVADLEVTGSLPGIAPFVRGPRATMYAASHGPSANMPGFPPPKNPMLFIAAIWRPGKRGCRWPSICRPIGVMIPIMNVSPATWAKPGWLSIASKI